ncbi:MAG: hypothetical protein FWD45_06825, partial [Coriobacteriia bacterium]|nr:hypothetical protein [Coriobacteriia bacterium]
MIGDPIIKTISDRLFETSALNNVVEKLGTNSDISVAVPISTRPLFIAATFARSPSSMLVLTGGEAAADMMVRELRQWLSSEQVLRMPLYTHQPWREQVINTDHIAQVGQRNQAVTSLQRGERKIVVASIEAILRKIPIFEAHQRRLLVSVPQGGDGESASGEDTTVAATTAATAAASAVAATATAAA